VSHANSLGIGCWTAILEFNFKILLKAFELVSDLELPTVTRETVIVSRNASSLNA
jgi:hypothetical protein